MNKTKSYEELQREVKEARDYVARIGAPQHHFRDGSVGKLYGCLIKTQVCHQSSPGANNYHDGSAFDLALSEVVRSRFKELAQETIEAMEKASLQALIQEEKQLRERLQQVEKAKATLNE